MISVITNRSMDIANEIHIGRDIALIMVQIWRIESDLLLLLNTYIKICRTILYIHIYNLFNGGIRCKKLS